MNIPEIHERIEYLEIMIDYYDTAIDYMKRRHLEKSSCKCDSGDEDCAYSYNVSQRIFYHKELLELKNLLDSTN